MPEEYHVSLVFQRDRMVSATARRLKFCHLLMMALSCFEWTSAFSAEPEIQFERDIAPLLASRCLECHRGPEPKGGLDLSSRESALKGGESGPALNLSDLTQSFLWQRIRDGEMPPKHPLPPGEQKQIHRWLDSGAPWGNGPLDPLQYTTDQRAGYDWWSLRPLVKPPVPEVGDALKSQVRNPIDAFVVHTLSENGLSLSPPADPALLVRRLVFQLTGLPAPPELIAQLVGNPSEEVYQSIVDRQLSSVHFGERWARHWLDVARYGESQGFERDKLRPNAWPYRDWLIRSFNTDLPYDEFVRLQIAGDILHPDDSQSLAATGFLVAGPYDEVGQKQQSLAMRRVVRQDEMEDIVGTVGQTFLGLTVNCARCHDHKFDPISQVDYYRFVCALDGVHHGERPFRTAEQQQQIASLQGQIESLTQDRDALEAPIREQIMKEWESPLELVDIPKPLSHWMFEGDSQDQRGKHHMSLRGNARIESGRLILDGQDAFAIAGPVSKAIQAKTLSAWVELGTLDQRGGGVISLQSTDGVAFDAIVFGERNPRQWLAGSNSFVRTKPFAGPEEQSLELVHVAIVYGESGTIRAYRNGIAYGEEYVSSGLYSYATGSQVILGMRHGSTAGGNRMLAAAIEEASLFDTALTAEQVAALGRSLKSITQTQLVSRLNAEDRGTRERLLKELAAAQEQLSALQSSTVYSVTPQQPAPTHLLLRGNPASPGETVPPGGVAAVNDGESFGLTADSPEGERRRELAMWMTSPENPLFARVMVNRVWHYYFGRGIVESPNDFGFNGGRPSHPELLDYLAASFIEQGYSLKWLHRMIVSSATFRQSSALRSDALAVDAGNQWLWRKSPLRLDAEELRDALLSISGKLNMQVGGPPYEDFKTFTFNSQFYEIFDPETPQTQRRTLYRTWVRSGRNPLLDVFDCPDPSTTAPRRAMTTTPLQSLSLLNNAFVLRMADACAARLEHDAGGDLPRQIERLWQLSYGRSPDPQEMRSVADFAVQHGLPATCRAVWNSNEFLHIE